MPKGEKTGSVDPAVKSIKARIIYTQGSEGLPSCGLTDNQRLGGGKPDTVNIGGTDSQIEKETPYSYWPFSLIFKLFPGSIPKSPRNFQKWQDNQNKK